MRIFRTLGLLCLTISAVMTAPAQSMGSKTEDSVEQELVRHHHSTLPDDSNDADDNTYSAEKGNLGDESSPVESIEDIPDNTRNDRIVPYDEDDLYDITVGDVIRDVLMTLHDHPEIVKELIESEKDRIAIRLAQDATESISSDLPEFQTPAKQLKNEPKRVQKKDGQLHTSEVINEVNGNQGNGLRTDDAEFNGYMNHKRTNEVLDETFTSDSKSADSFESYDGYTKFMKSSEEPDNKYKMIYGGSSQEDSSSSGYRRHFGDSSESDDSRSIKDFQSKYRLPIMNPIAMYKHYKNSGSSSQSSETDDSSSQEMTKSRDGSDVQSEDSKSNENSSDSSEEQLSWLLHQMEANRKKEAMQQTM